MNSLTRFAAAFAVASTAITAQAAIVTQWEATQTSIWTAFAPAGVTLSGGGSTLSWGTPSGQPNQSSLVITNPAANQNVTTYIGGGMPPQVAPFLGSGGTLTHNNNVITGTSLDTATLTATLFLEAFLPPAAGQPGALPPLQFNIAFEETPNAGTCAATSPPGNPCNDIFVLLGGFLNQSFLYDTDGAGGDPTQQYFVNIFPTLGSVLSVLQPSECAAAGQPNGCVGFTTIEGQANTLTFGFTISTEQLTTQVPEPTTLALLGLALAGLGFARRRSH